MQILENGVKNYGLELPETAAPAFRKYFELLDERSRVMNLTAIDGESDIYTLHFLDSLFLLTLDDFKGKSVIDIGSGAGFPGLPMKIAQPEISLTLLDAQQKRVDFMSEVCSAVNAEDTVCLHARAEEAAFDNAMRGSFDFAVSRAVARLNVLCELCMPFVRTGGSFIAMKSTGSDDELNEAGNAIDKLGGEIVRIADYNVPCTDVIHRAVVIKKVSETPAGYPRRFAKIQKKPL